jgi:hypothetical protein
MPPIPSEFDTWFTVNGPDQPFPLNTNAFPPTSPATQSDDDTHATVESEFRVASTGTGEAHALPLYVIAFPLLSTAAQNAADGHDTAVRLFPFGSGSTGELHALPLKVSTKPPVPTAAQNVADGHETAVAGPEPDTFVGPDHPAGAATAEPATPSTTLTAAIRLAHRYALITHSPDVASGSPAPDRRLRSTRPLPTRRS